MKRYSHEDNQMIPFEAGAWVKVEDVREAFDTIEKRLAQEPFERREFIATWVDALRSEILQQNSQDRVQA